MGKEKIEEKDVRLLRYAVEQAFDGAMRDGALALLNRLVDSASEAANLEEELLNLKGEYQRSMENSKRGAFKRLHAAYKRKCRREKRMAKGQMLCADGKPVMFVERAVEDAVMGWLPCDRDGVTEDEEGMVPDDATVAYISTLDGSREERAFNLAKHDYYGFLDYKEDRYTTVYGYMD